MAYVRSKMLLSSELGRSSARPLPSLSPQSIECSPGTRRELETLRSMNAYLVNEVAALKEREAEVLRLAERDGLTGLFNRRAFAVLDFVAQIKDEKGGNSLADGNRFGAVHRSTLNSWRTTLR